MPKIRKIRQSRQFRKWVLVQTNLFLTILLAAAVAVECHLLGASNANEMAFGVGEVADDEIAIGILGGSHDALATKPFGFLEGGFDIWHADVEDGIAGEVLATADATGNADAIGGGVAVDEAVIPGLGYGGCDRRGGVVFPSEEVAEIAAEFGGIFADDFEVYNWLSHDMSFYVR